MVDAVAIGSAVSSLKAAFDIAKGIHELKTTADIQSKTMELNAAILAAQASALEAQSEQVALLKRIDSLEAEIAQMKAWETEKQNYEAADTGQGTLAFRVKGSVDSSTPPHWLCPTCYHENQKSFMQKETHAVGRTEVLYCHRCGMEIITRGVRQESQKRPGRLAQPRR